MRIIIAIAFLLGIATTLFAKNFESNIDYIWADTPAGRFECQRVTSKNGDSFQELTLGGKVIYQQPENGFVESGPILSSEYGLDKGGGLMGLCPEILDNREGYVIFSAIESPPGVEGAPNTMIIGNFAINFNVSPPVVIPLPQSKGRDGKAYDSRFTWDMKGLTMRYYGFPYGVDGMGGSKPKFHIYRFEFATKKGKQLK